MNSLDIQPSLLPDEQLRLYRLALDGDDDAYNDLALSLGGMVLDVASRYDTPVPFEDLVQEGFLGIARALHRFDPDQGTAFSTYAYFWIRQAINRAVHSGRSMRMPETQSTLLCHLFSMLHSMRQELGREPTEDEINDRADELGITPTFGVTPYELMVSSIPPDSLDREIYGGDKEVGEFIPDPKDIEETVDQSILAADIEEVAEDCLIDRERKVVFGKLCGEPDRVIAERWGCSKTWIGMIKLDAFRKLRKGLKERGYGEL